jgi:hypothetical protein
MANQGAKKRKDENARHMAKLRLIMILCNILYVLVRVIISHSSHTWKNWIGLVLTSLGYGIPYKLLHQMAKPSVSDAGELLDGGFDMSTPGMCGYVRKDLSFKLIN